MGLFFPSHDIALSNGVKHFNPPAAALRLQEDLASLSTIWNQPFLRGESEIPLPWGWDWDTRRWIHDHYRIPYSKLPSDDDLEQIRQLSSRQKMIDLIYSIEQGMDKQFEYHPTYLINEDEVNEYINRHDQQGTRFVLKTPWSSSGRGLTVSHVKSREGGVSTTPRDQMLRHAKATIRKMGGIMAEEWIEGKLHDFALLFFASKAEVSFIGFSLFENDDAAGGTTYRQGYLLSNEAIRQQIGIDTAYLDRLIEASTSALNLLLNPLMGQTWEVGYLGIDMLTYRRYSPKKPAERACVIEAMPLELNLRCTMGVVCRLWHDQHQQDGIFRITPMKDNGHFEAEFLLSK